MGKTSSEKQNLKKSSNKRDKRSGIGEKQNLKREMSLKLQNMKDRTN